jgi:hypothetical protein
MAAPSIFENTMTATAAASIVATAAFVVVIFARKITPCGC